MAQAPQKRAKPPAQQQKRHGYRNGMLALFVVLCLVVGAVLVFVWQALEKYESTTPKAALDTYFLQLAAEDYGAIQAGADFAPSALNGWEDYYLCLQRTFGSEPSLLSYRRVAGESGDTPAVTLGQNAAGPQRYAIFNGEEELGKVLLYPEAGLPHGWRVSAVVEEGAAYTVTAPGHAAVVVNGVPLDPNGPNVQRTICTGFEALPDEELQPQNLVYTLEPTLVPPEFTATGPAAVACTVEVNRQNHSAAVTVPLTPNEQEEYTALIEAAAKSYATFVTNDGSLRDLQTHLYPGTDLAARMANFYGGWYLEHEGYDFANMAVENLVSTGLGTFSGEITFDYLVYKGGATHTFPTRYEMYFARYGEDWRLAELQAR